MNDDVAWACWIEAPQRAAWRREVLPAPGAGEVRVRALVSGVSRGTETLVYRGEVPEGERLRMRAPFQRGDFPGPVKYGYCSVGVVTAGDPSLEGRTVFCLHPHQSAYLVPRDAVHPVPDDVPAGRAVLAANVETALNAVWDAAVGPGDSVSVVGAGVVGALVGWLCAGVPGCRVQLVDVDPRREALARALGASFALPEAAAGEADVVVHASATEAGLATALRLAGFEATVLELSWYGTRRVSVPLGEAFHARRLRLASSQVGHVAASRRARWSHARRLAAALQLLRDERLDALLGDPHPAGALPALLARLAAGPGDGRCERIAYSDDPAARPDLDASTSTAHTAARTGSADPPRPEPSR
jgi:threonine dehydrogenase-like Zn-dependent dehydrogenase